LLDVGNATGLLYDGDAGRSSVMISAGGLNFAGKSRMLRTVAARNE
jgi:hypothetical protein